MGLPIPIWQLKIYKTADKLGVQMKVETQGGIGVENELTEQDIREADALL